MFNTKTIATLVVTAISFAGISASADFSENGKKMINFNKKSIQKLEISDEIKAIFDKKRSGEELTEDEKTTLKEFKSENKLKKKSHRPDRKIMKKVRNGEELTENEKVIYEKFIERRNAHLDELSKNASEEVLAIISKIKAGEKLTEDERETIKEAHKANREAKKQERYNNAPEEIKKIMDKRGSEEKPTKEERKKVREYIKSLKDA